MATPSLKPTSTYPAVVGAVLAKLREQKGLQQSQVAAAIQVSQSTWSRIERGDAVLTLEQLAAAARVLQTTPQAILGHADRAVEHMKQRGIHVRPQRASEGLSNTEVLIAVAAILIIVALVMRKK
jgi:transcriptional regulator with XRE-family HTH domain